MRQVILWLLCLLVVLPVCAGCQLNSNTAGSTSAAGEGEPSSRLDATVESTSITSLETAPLEIVSWDDRRIMDSGFSSFAETETGFYFHSYNWIFYADKSDSSVWVPLCSKPDCPHYDPEDHDKTIDCDAYSAHGFIRKGDRLYYLVSGPIAAFPNNWYYSPYLVSMALDGTDKQIVFHFQYLEEHGGGGNFDLTLDHYFYYQTALNKEGTYDQVALVADAEGAYQVYAGIGEEESQYVRNVNAMYGIRGDTAYYIADIDGSYTTIYRIQNRQLVGTDMKVAVTRGNYLSGNTLRQFRPNDGYYLIDLETQAETKLAGPQLENSHAIILQPNCILESTLICLDMRVEKRDFAVDQHQMRFFDGQTWQDVTLPEELLHAGETIFVTPQALASDRIIVQVVDNATYEYTDESFAYAKYYQIMLGTDTPALEYMGEIRLPGT